VKRLSAKTVLALGTLAILELTIFFSSPGHFFQGDTLYWLANPYRSIADFARGFIELDPGGWYRPISQRTVESLLLPVVGLNPVPYRLVSFILFLLCTVTVFVLIENLTRRWVAALIGTSFFATHIIHAYTTYDVAFTPEFLYSTFYILAVIAWWRYLQEGRKGSAAASVVFFAGGLLSKEAAVTLPAVLFMLSLVTPTRKQSGVRWLAAHLALLGMYLAFVVGYLGVGGIDIRRVLQSPGRAGVTGYQLVIGENILSSLKTSSQWVFGFPAGAQGNWQLPAPWMFVILYAFSLTVIVAAVLSLWSANRRLVLFGLSWFVISASPMLPLIDHFLPYYLLAPLAGVSIVVGVVLAGAYERLSRIAPAAVSTAGILLLTTYGAASASAVWHAQHSQPLLGGSSQIAATAVADMRAMHPRLSAGTILVFLNEEDPGIWWNHAQGGLFQMAYDDRTLTAQYSTLGLSVSDTDVANDRVRYFKTRGGRIVPYEPYRVELSKPAVAAGESYTLWVPGLAETDLLVLFSVDGKPASSLRTRLDSNGHSVFAVTKTTPPGVYTVVGVKKPDEPAWTLTRESIVVSAVP
jgi:hypothetical protein